MKIASNRVHNVNDYFEIIRFYSSRDENLA